MVTKPDRIVTHLDGLLPIKPLYLDYHNAYGHQTRQDVELPWATPNQKVTWPFAILHACMFFT